MEITAAQLNAAGVAPTQAAAIVQALNAAMDRFDIVTAPRIAAFVGQCMVESGPPPLTHFEENLFYTHADRLARMFPRKFRTAADAAPYTGNPAKLAAHVYAGRDGNGDEASGDGWTYRGRGLIQLTGRGNYTDAAQALGRDYVGKPEIVALPDDACLTAAWFWGRIKANALADANAIDAITRAINGTAMEEAALRRQYTQQVLQALAS
jgi:putative chitinase